MRLHGNTSGRLRRLGLGMTMAAAAAVTLAACSSSAAPASHVATTQPASAPPSATTAASSTPAAATSELSGTWSGRYSGAFQGTFTLTWQQSGSKLHGTIKLSAPPDTLSINGRVTDGTIRFGTVGSVGITYSGTVSGSSMSGNYQVQSANGPVGGPWSAAKSS
jgi:ABC-type phosphate transport system substrate-binding protein